MRYSETERSRQYNTALGKLHCVAEQITMKAFNGHIIPSVLDGTNTPISQHTVLSSQSTITQRDPPTAEIGIIAWRVST